MMGQIRPPRIGANFVGVLRVLGHHSSHKPFQADGANCIIIPAAPSRGKMKKFQSMEKDSFSSWQIETSRLYAQTGIEPNFLFVNRSAASVARHRLTTSSRSIGAMSYSCPPSVGASLRRTRKNRFPHPKRKSLSPIVRPPWQLTIANGQTSSRFSSSSRHSAVIGYGFFTQRSMVDVFAHRHFS